MVILTPGIESWCKTTPGALFIVSFGPKTGELRRGLIWRVFRYREVILSPIGTIKCGKSAESHQDVGDGVGLKIFIGKSKVMGGKWYRYLEGQKSCWGYFDQFYRKIWRKAPGTRGRAPFEKRTHRSGDMGSFSVKNAFFECRKRTVRDKWVWIASFESG